MVNEKNSAETTTKVAGYTALYLGVAQNLSMIHSADDAIENKVTAFLAGSLVILALVLGRTETWRVLTFIGVSLLVIGILVAVYILRSRGYNSVAINVSENLDYLSFEQDELLLHLISDAEDSINTSTKILNEKVRLYHWVLALFVFGSATGLLSFYIKIVGV
jgi:hypothetical protein